MGVQKRGPVRRGGSVRSRAPYPLGHGSASSGESTLLDGGVVGPGRAAAPTPSVRPPRCCPWRAGGNNARGRRRARARASAGGGGKESERESRWVELRATAGRGCCYLVGQVDRRRGRRAPALHSRRDSNPRSLDGLLSVLRAGPARATSRWRGANSPGAPTASHGGARPEVAPGRPGPLYILFPTAPPWGPSRALSGLPGPCWGPFWASLRALWLPAAGRPAPVMCAHIASCAPATWCCRQRTCVLRCPTPQQEMVLGSPCLTARERELVARLHVAARAACRVTYAWPRAATVLDS
eukprot:scaffold1315_cov405-Prasinococcus_capsulatus_cf.AAC.1